MLKKSFFSLLFVLTFALLGLAQGATTPAKGSSERTAILNALRVPVEKELKQKVQFAVNDFKVSGNWAFISGEPQNMNGGRPNYKGTQYQSAINSDAFDNNFFALLKKTSGKWKVITYAIGCTDVCYATWWKDYKAPKAVFPYTE
jgi:hypothetical protein